MKKIITVYLKIIAGKTKGVLTFYSALGDLLSNKDSGQPGPCFGIVSLLKFITSAV